MREMKSVKKIKQLKLKSKERQLRKEYSINVEKCHLDHYEILSPSTIELV